MDINRPIWSRIFLSQYLVFYICVLYYLVILMFKPEVASLENTQNTFSNMLPLLTVAVGQTIVLITGGIDLSVIAIIPMASITGAWIMTSDGGVMAGSPWAAPVGIICMLVVGTLLGIINGGLIAAFKMPPFIVTLATQMFFGGFAVWLTQSENIYHLPEAFNLIGYGQLFGIPYALLVAAPVILAAHFLLTRTLMGKWLYAVGHNIKAALISGVPIKPVVIFAYAFSGFCAAAAAVLYTARLETGSPAHGREILLDVVGAVVIGGTSLFGGKGKVPWTLFGVLLIILIGNSLNMLGLSYFAIMMVKGGVILLAALIDALRNRWLVASSVVAS
ncbi:MAG: ABC transporter permease [Planctomycetota bacterium]